MFPWLDNRMDRAFLFWALPSQAMLRVIPLTEAVEWLLRVLRTTVPQLGCSSVRRMCRELQQDLMQTSESSQGSRAGAFHYRYADLRQHSSSWECCFMCVCLYVLSACRPYWFGRNPLFRGAYWGEDQCAKAGVLRQLGCMCREWYIHVCAQG